MMRATFLITLLTTLSAGAADGGSAGCSPAVKADTTDTTSALTDGTSTTGNAGALAADAVLMYWAWYSEWDGGTCIDLSFKNEGPALTGWVAVVQFDQALGELSWEDGAAIDTFMDELIVSSSSNSSFDTNTVVAVNVCLEPQVIPVRFQMTSSAGTVSSDGGSEDEGEDEVELEVVPTLDAAKDGAENVLVYFEQDGTRTDSEICYDVTINNLTAHLLTDWRVEMALDRDVELAGTDDDLYFVQNGDDQLLVFPAADSAVIDPYDSVEGEVCLRDAARLDRIDAVYTLVATGSTPVGDDGSDPTGDTTGDTDTEPPLVHNVVGAIVNGDHVQITFETSEPATALVCDAELNCWYAASTNSLHSVLVPRGSQYTIQVTDEAGNSNEVGPFPF